MKILQSTQPNATLLIRLLIADDHPMARAGITGLLRGTEIEVTAQATNCEEAVRYCAACSPDVVLLDVRMPDADGFTAMQRIRERRPTMPIIMLSASDDLEALSRARELGAQGFLSKAASRQELIDAIRKVVAGRPAWSKPYVRKASKKLSLPKNDEAVSTLLTPREVEIVRMIGRGMTNEDIATALSISVETIKHHLNRMFQKVMVEDRTQLAIWALREGIL